MKNKLILCLCFFSCVCILNVFGDSDEKQFDEMDTPKNSSKQKQSFLLSDLFANFNNNQQQRSKKVVKEKKDYFAEDFQAFAEDDPWDM